MHYEQVDDSICEDIFHFMDLVAAFGHGHFICTAYQCPDVSFINQPQ
jgi:hypothetical protein